MEYVGFTLRFSLRKNNLPLLIEILDSPNEGLEVG